MAPVCQSRVENCLLKSMDPATFELIAPHLTSIELPLKRVLVEADKPVTHVCFVESGLASMIAVPADGEAVDVGHVGREGMTGEHLVMMSDSSPIRTFVQVRGTGYLMPAAVLADILNANQSLQRLFLRYIHCINLQIAHAALANARYSISGRLARRLLMVHDRLDGDDLPLTHQLLSMMLGVRRPSVTDQIHMMESSHCIKATRANIRVVDRQKLEEIADGSYGVPEREYERLIGLPISKHPRL
jgi:CRP-like cAMP-binding protein